MQNAAVWSYYKFGKRHEFILKKKKVQRFKLKKIVKSLNER